MQSVGAAWLMVSLHAGPLYVALTQTASALPFFVLALPAGAIGDIVDRRKLILFTEAWMLAVAVVLTVLTMAGLMSPIMLLVLTFALSAGDAVETPTWRAVLPELVPNEDLPAASALNGIEFNFARAIGPALAGVLIAVLGVGAAFLVNALSFFGVIMVVARWRRRAVKRTTPPETIGGATVAAIRYVHYSPEIRAVIFRAGAAMFFASGLLALLPSMAQRINGSPMGYGVLLGCFGGGAVLGALAMQRARARWSADIVVNVGIAMFGVVTVAAGAVHRVPLLAVLMLIGGAAWVSFISLLNVQVLNQVPDWVRARVLAVSMLVFQGAVAGGSALWGSAAARMGIDRALLWAGIGTIATTALGLFLRFPETGVDLTPWNHWRMPATIPAELDAGPVLVTVEYFVDSEHVNEFLKAIHEFGRIRRRDGASRWGISRDLETPDRYLETFVVASVAEHLRQHERLTRADGRLETRLGKLSRSEPSVHHLIYL
jgi:predicted MFS family arabinose efflux permease